MGEIKRKAGDYEIIQSMHVGRHEVVIGEYSFYECPDGKRYFVSFCDNFDIFEKYNEIQYGDSYPAIVQEYCKRISELAGEVLEEQKTAVQQGIALKPFVDYVLLSHDDDIENKVVVIKPEVLRREYRTQFNQLVLCTGGFGSHPNSRGSACYSTILYSGEETRYERYDIAGIVPEDKLPEWAKQKLEAIRNKPPEKKKENKGAR